MTQLEQTLIAGLSMWALSQDGFPQTKPDDSTEIREAVVESVERLNRPACSSLLGANARDILISARFVVISFGKPKLGSDGKFKVISASVDGDRNTIIINSEGPFMDPRLTVNGVRFNLGLDDHRFRALILLHELGHLTGKFQHDGADPELSRTYSNSVREACFL